MSDGAESALDAVEVGAGHRQRGEHRGRLFRRYLLLILTLVTIALLASGAISVYFTYEETKDALASVQHEKAIAAASRIEQYILQIERELGYAALPQLDASNVELRRIEFLKLLRQAPEVTDVAQLDAVGRERLNVSRLGMDSIASGRDRSQEPAFREAHAGRAWFGPVYFRKETEPYMTIALRSGGDSGVITLADVNLKFIWDVVSRIRIGDKGKAYVVDDKGYLVADPDIGLVLRKTNLGSLPHVRAATGPPRDDAQLAMLSTNLTGTRVLTSVAPIDALRWNVFVEQPVSEVYARLNASILRTALLLLAGLALSALGALALARRMVRPIRKLEEGAQRIGAGDLDQRLDIHTGDELESLAAQFNRMSAKLRESYAGLERKVDERTRELRNALEQQTAISEILRVISSSPTDVQPVLEAVAERAAHLCGAPFARVMVIDDTMLSPLAEYSTDPVPLSKPVPLARTSITGRAVIDRAIVHLADVAPVAAAEFPDAVENMDALGCRAVLAVPLLREGGAYGAIFLFRREPGLFASDQVALVQTFARQAVIAIENVRLFNETKEALEQQTAVAEILRVISSSPTDVQPVFDTIAPAALKLCQAASALVFTFDGELIHLAASANVDPDGAAAWHRSFPRPPSRDTAATRAVLTGEVVMIPDVLADPDYRIGPTAATTGFRKALAVPLIRDGKAIGVIGVGGPDAGPFPDHQIALLQTFADQAVIAIENVRLFNETKEALDQQTAVAEILRIIAGSPGDVRPMFKAVAERALTLCEAAEAGVFLVEADVLRFATGVGTMAIPEENATFPLTRGLVVGRAAIDRQTFHYPDILQYIDSEYPEARVPQQRFGFRALLAVPLMREDRAIGAIALWRREPRGFTPTQIALIKTFADQAAIAIENVRLFNETKEALEQQTAVAEILRVISSSPTTVQPVLEAIAERAAKLCDASAASMYLLDGNVLRHLASRGPSPDPVSHVDALPIDRDSVSGRAFLEQRAIQVPDMLAAGEEYPASRALAERFAHRTVLVMPLMREGASFGTILLRRREVRPFVEREIALLRTFGDQAAIALENVRLFNETKEALEQQRASGEVLAAISSSIADTAPVFETILSSCERLFAGKIAVIDLIGEDGLVHLGAYHGPHLDEVRKLYPHTATTSSATGTAIASRAVVHYPRFELAPDTARRAFEVFGIRAVIGAPMIWENQGLGAIFVARDRTGPFSDSEIALLKTFADQAVIAIQNARLFREIEEKSRQLEIANKHKSEFLANMSHELRTPLNAIIGFSEVLLERLFGDLNEKQDDYLKDIHSSGKHLLSLINDILDLSKIEAGRMELDASRFDVADAISNAMTLVRERAQQHAISLSHHVDPSLGAIVADERKFKQILLNLLSNAVKFTPQGGRVDVVARRIGNEAQVEVSDTGVGIAPEDQDAVFEEFRQVGRDYTKKQEGTGLGLALVRRLVELHGGRVSLDSAPGRGSTFTFTIPIRP